MQTGQAKLQIGTLSDRVRLNRWRVFNRELIDDLHLGRGGQNEESEAGFAGVGLPVKQASVEG